MNLTYGSVCSGIEAATVAWHPLGWKPAWFAQFDPEHDYDLGPDYPSKVLAYHYPDVQNLGDLTTIAAKVRALLVPAPDVLVGGTPCQAFSIAGLRQSLDDARGQLTLAFVDLANAIDTVRHVRGEQPAIVLWENVPGVLNTPDNAFGCFLGALAGEDGPLLASGGKWTNAGCVFGPQRTVAWRVLDAQYFGVAQRRRRVFDGVRRDIAPSRETGKDVAAGTLRSSDGGVDADRAIAGHVQPVLTCASNAEGTNGLPFLTCSNLAKTVNNQTPLLSFEARSVALRGREGGATAELGDDLAGTLRAGGGGGGDKAHVLAPVVSAPVQRSVERPRGDGLDTLIAFDTTQITSKTNRCQPKAGDPCHPLSAQAHAPAIAFDSRQDPVSSTEVFGALGSSSPQAQAVCVTGDVTHTLKAEGFDASEDGTGRGQPIVTERAYTTKLHNTTSNQAGKIYEEYAVGLQANSPPPALLTSMAVRRLMPIECERLQGFPDGYTRIPTKKAKKRSKLYEYEVIDGQLWQMAADGPRYKSLGNSMAVPNMRWLGRRIEAGLSPN